MSSHFQLLTSYATLGKIVYLCEPQFTNLCKNVVKFMFSKFVDSTNLYHVTLLCWRYKELVITFYKLDFNKVNRNYFM